MAMGIMSDHTGTLTMDRLQFSPQVIEWAASRMGLTLHELAHKISKRNPEKILEGELTEPQAIKISKKARIRLGDLFLEAPPLPPSLPIADFRTLQQPEPLSDDFFETFRDIEFKQSWYREYLEDIGAEPLSFIGSFSGKKSGPAVIASSMRSTLKLDSIVIDAVRSSEELYSHWVTRAEAAGVLVFKNGVVGNNGHRKLSVGEFRGFVICDQLAPVIFINGNDAAAAWLFTLAHELAHLWLGQSGVSDVSPQSKNPQEILCNEIAAELLVPSEQFAAFWRQNTGRMAGEIFRLGRLQFKVSELVIARRALDAKLIPLSEYQQVYRQTCESARKKKSSGGDFYVTHKVRNSKVFSAKVAGLAATGAISFREAGRLLHISPSKVMAVYKKSRAISS